MSIRRFERLQRNRPTFGEAYNAFLGRHSLADIGVAPDVATSLRDPAAGRKVPL